MGTQQPSLPNQRIRAPKAISQGGLDKIMNEQQHILSAFDRDLEAIQAHHENGRHG